MSPLFSAAVKQPSVEDPLGGEADYEADDSVSHQGAIEGEGSERVKQLWRYLRVHGHLSAVD